ncbi:MAG TPA: hypothetical protein VNF71_02955 [Acidimicrobiales bacterium]|nr:hypothetical protein [Acidimicrobiales bacterium]
MITLLVLLIDASLHSRSPGPGQQLAAGAWVDRVLPVVSESNTEGVRLQQLWSGALTMKAPAVSSEMDQLASGAAEAYKTVVSLRPPAQLAGAAGLLEACLLARSQAVASLQGVFRQALSEPGVSAASASDVQTAGNDLRVSDQAYHLFVSSLPRLGVGMPPSVWLSDPGPYQPPSAQVFLASLHNAGSSSPVHQVTIYAVSTTPSPVSNQGGVQVLPDAKAITVTIVVADTGNQNESNLTVTASISPSAGTSSAKDFVNLVPGQAHTILNLGPLNPPQGTLVTLTVTVTPPAGSQTPAATKTISFSMPAPPPPSTTTSVPPTTVKSGH